MVTILWPVRIENKTFMNEDRNEVQLIINDIEISCYSSAGTVLKRYSELQFQVFVANSPCNCSGDVPMNPLGASQRTNIPSIG